jgi:transposase-like protein
MEQTKYSSEFKADALRLAESEGVKEASEKLGVRTRQIYDWRRTERLRQNKISKAHHPGETLQEANKRLEK